MTDLIDRITALFLQGQQPWWIYAAIVFIPFCVILCFREVFCWFWKINKLINRLERLDTRLNGLQGAITRMEAVQNAFQEPIVETPPVVAVKPPSTKPVTAKPSVNAAPADYTLNDPPSKEFKLK